MLCKEWEKHSNFTQYSVCLIKSTSIQNNSTRFIVGGLNAGGGVGMNLTPAGGPGITSHSRKLRAGRISALTSRETLTAVLVKQKRESGRIPCEYYPAEGQILKPEISHVCIFKIVLKSQWKHFSYFLGVPRLEAWTIWVIIDWSTVSVNGSSGVFLIECLQACEMGKDLERDISELWKSYSVSLFQFPKQS